MTTNLWLGNLFAYSVQVGAIVLTLTVAVRLFQLRNPKLLLMSWQVLLAVCLLLPLIQPYQPVPWQTSPSAALSGVRSEVHLSDPVHARPFKLVTLLPWLLVGGVVFRLAWLAMGVSRLRFYRRRAGFLDLWPETWKEMERHVGVFPKVCLSGDLAGPATTGLLHPIVLLPEGFLQMPLQLQRAIACHELWHVRRRDYLFALFEEVLAALLWFHPAIWWLLNRIRLHREQVVDHLVVETTNERKPYLEALIQFAIRHPKYESIVAPLFFKRHHLPQRAALILSEVAMSKSHVLVSIGVLSTVLLFTGTIAVKFFPIQSHSPDRRAPNVQANARPDDRGTISISVGEEALTAKLIHRVKPEYPVEAKEKGVEGQVQLQITIEENGEVGDIQVIGGNAVLVPAAIEAVRQWQYLPFLLDGKPVRVKATVTEDFSLEASGGTPSVRPTSNKPITVQTTPPIYKVGNGVTPPRVLSRVAPTYTQEARDAKVQGTIMLTLEISAQGVPQNIHVVQGLGMGLDISAVQAITQWRFAPATLNGEPVPVRINSEINFSLK